MIIKSFFPNPVGKDPNGEWIKIYNDGLTAQNLRGWVIKDKSGKNFNFSDSVLEPRTERTLPYAETKIALNNSDEALFLYNDQSVLVDQLASPGSSAEGAVISATGANLMSGVAADLFEPAQPLPSLIAHAFPARDFFVFMFLTAALLAALSTYVIQKFSAN